MIHHSPSLVAFKRSLKTHFSLDAFPDLVFRDQASAISLRAFEVTFYLQHLKNKHFTLCYIALHYNQSKLTVMSVCHLYSH